MYACQSNPGDIVLNNENYKKMVIQILIRIGTNMILTKEDETDTMRALIMAKSVCVLELYETGIDDSIEAALYSRGIGSKLRDLDEHVCSYRRDVLKFLSKRIPCSCLKSMHREARKISPIKTGMCYGCFTETGRVALSVCSKCMIYQFCSKECQVANWPYHRIECDKMSDIHKQRTQRVVENAKTEG